MYKCNENLKTDWHKYDISVYYILRRNENFIPKFWNIQGLHYFIH